MPQIVVNRPSLLHLPTQSALQQMQNSLEKSKVRDRELATKGKKPLADRLKVEKNKATPGGGKNLNLSRLITEAPRLSSRRDKRDANRSGAKA